MDFQFENHGYFPLYGKHEVLLTAATLDNSIMDILLSETPTLISSLLHQDRPFDWPTPGTKYVSYVQLSTVLNVIERSIYAQYWNINNLPVSEMTIYEYRYYTQLSSHLSSLVSYHNNEKYLEQSYQLLSSSVLDHLIQILDLVLHHHSQPNTIDLLQAISSTEDSDKKFSLTEQNVSNIVEQVNVMIKAVNGSDQNPVVATGGTSHHFGVINRSKTSSAADNHDIQSFSSSQQTQKSLWTKNGRIPSKYTPATSWKIARDKSMDILSRKSTKLNLHEHKQTPINLPPIGTVFRQTRNPYKTPRMPTDDEVTKYAIAYELKCYFCGEQCISSYVRCRSDLTRLLNHDELSHLISTFEDMDHDKDGYITLGEFLSRKRAMTTTPTDSLDDFIRQNIDHDKLHFRIMDRSNTGVLAWSDFVLFYTAKLLAKKNKSEISAKLSEKELVFAKMLFMKEMRITKDTATITKEQFIRIHNNLKHELKKKYGSAFLKNIISECDDDLRISRIEKTGANVISWEEFIRKISLFILLNRTNDYVKISCPQRAMLPNHLQPVGVAKSHIISHLTFAGRTTPADDDEETDVQIEQKIHQLTEQQREAFSKYTKIFSKRSEQEKIKEWSIVENDDSDHQTFLPKLKSDAKDGRQSIAEPWLVVKDMQLLRVDPIDISTIYRSQTLSKPLTLTYF
ncbi:unnamed protein product [Didymodactylos carnosus]|uniref:EF-hand domain-containing protein n=1 Tax=Didymodactylos carnosus TaxID=1234261 RepID=A0A813WX84_9BILA|nr:unnamed protein product [Didymodactylos carnosus]CAF0861902.1 unnamed protein product [Didymodactylos carnosus]CAF3566291.1 unnamed protein product [Didymodactylos carnosus]CAF3649550.1 unnamed protein product [Didymodactylos carnosus]